MTSDTILKLRKTFQASRLRFNDEKGLQDAIAEMLTSLGIEFEREKILGPEERPDFFIDADGLAIEVKVDGSATKHLRQLARYARHEVVLELLLISPKPHSLPASLGAKPLHSIAFWTSLL